jgi:hypothetical protein
MGRFPANLINIIRDEKALMDRAVCRDYEVEHLLTPVRHFWLSALRLLKAMHYLEWKNMYEQYWGPPDPTAEAEQPPPLCRAVISALIRDMMKQYPLIMLHRNVSWNQSSGLEYSSWWNGGIENDPNNPNYDYFQLRLSIFCGTVKAIRELERFYQSLQMVSWYPETTAEDETFAVILLEKRSTVDLRLEWNLIGTPTHHTFKVSSSQGFIEQGRDVIDFYYDRISVTQNIYWSCDTFWQSYSMLLKGYFTESPIANHTMRQRASYSLEKFVATASDRLLKAAAQLKLTDQDITHRLDFCIFDPSNQETRRKSSKLLRVALLRYCRRAITSLIIPLLQTCFDPSQKDTVRSVLDSLIFPNCPSVREYPEDFIQRYQAQLIQRISVPFEQLSLRKSHIALWPLWAHHLFFLLSEAMVSLCTACFIKYHLQIYSAALDEEEKESSAIVEMIMQSFSESNYSSVLEVLQNRRTVTQK